MIKEAILEFFAEQQMKNKLIAEQNPKIKNKKPLKTFKDYEPGFIILAAMNWNKLTQLCAII